MTLTRKSPHLGGIHTEDLAMLREMLEHPASVLGIGDGGAHVRAICDASNPTFMLTHWVRDRTRGLRLPLEMVIHKMTGNNAALYGDWNMADQSFEYLKQVFDVNLHGVWLMTHAVAPHMVAQEFGRVINQSSAAAYNYRPTGADQFDGLNAFNYQQTKWGVVGLTKFTAAQLGRWNITVNCIAPGVIPTDATLKVVPRETVEYLATQQPVPGVIETDDLTGAAVYFASDEARFVTGQVLVIDGGKYMPA